MQLLALAVGSAVVLALVGLGVFVVIEGRDFNESLGPLIGYAAGPVSLLFAYAGLSEKLDRVHKQVNGNFSVLQDKNTALTDTLAQIATNSAPPEQNPESEVK